MIDVPLRLRLKPGATGLVRAKLALPADLAPGSYFVVVETLTGTPWTDPDPSDDTATSASPVAVQ